MKRLVLEYDAIRLDFDRDYGSHSRTGWSVALRGSYCVQLEPSLVKALWRAWKFARMVHRDPTSR